MKERSLHHHGDHPAIELTGIRHDASPDFKKQLKIKYSQPALPQSVAQIKSTADAVVSERPLTVKRGSETLTYDAKGRATVIQEGTKTLKRKYEDEGGYILEEELSGPDEQGNMVVEEARFYYESQKGKRVVQEIHVTSFVQVKLGAPELLRDEVIDLREFPAFTLLDCPKPPFTWDGDK